jgi:hypothetical protein
LTPIGNKIVQAGTTLSFPIFAGDPDLEPITFSASNLPAGAVSSYASTTVLPGGVMNWSPAAPAFNWTPASSQVGNHAVTFTVNDGRGGTASETIMITVNPP